jgi:hypothetical protein
VERIGSVGLSEADIAGINGKHAQGRNAVTGISVEDQGSKLIASEHIFSNWGELSRWVLTYPKHQISIVDRKIVRCVELGTPIHSRKSG